MDPGNLKYVDEDDVGTYLHDVSIDDNTEYRQEVLLNHVSKHDDTLYQ